MDRSDFFKHLALIGAGVFFTVLSLFFLKRKNLQPQNIPGLKWTRKPHTALSAYLKGASFFFYAYPPVFLTAQTLSLFTAYFFPEYKNEQVVVALLQNVRNSPVTLLLVSLYLVTVVPFFEELVFRGFLQMILKKILPWKGAIVMTSLIFASFHFSILQGISNIELLGALFVLSCYLGYFHEMGNSIFIPIGLHSAFNFVNIVLVSIL